MVLSINGLGSILALNLIDKTEDSQMAALKAEPEHARAEAAFRERIANITTAEELTDDYEVYAFVMKAYDLEDQIFGKGMMKAILNSDPDDDSSLLNRLTNSDFNDIHAGMGFVVGEGGTPQDFSSATWQQAIVDKYYETMYRNDYAAQNENVGFVLDFRNQVDGIDNWYEVLADSDLLEFFQIALSLPEEMSNLDVDKQVELLEDKFKIADLKDPEKVQDLITNFTAISDIVNPQGFTNTSTAVSLLNSSLFGGLSIISIDVPSISYSSSSIYR